MDPIQELREALPGDVVVTGADAVEKYRHDWSRDPSAGTPSAVEKSRHAWWGDPPAGPPSAVVRAEDAAQVQTALRGATAHGVPVVPRGAGSGLSGGSSAVDGGIVLSLERMTDIEIDTGARW